MRKLIFDARMLFFINRGARAGTCKRTHRRSLRGKKQLTPLMDRAPEGSIVETLPPFRGAVALKAFYLASEFLLSYPL
jgi:hypothetical protein